MGEGGKYGKGLHCCQKVFEWRWWKMQEQRQRRILWMENEMKRKLRALNTFYWHCHTHTNPPHTLCGTADLTTNLNPQAGGEKIQTKTEAGIKTIAMNFYNRQTASRQMKSIESNAVNRATIEMENVINRTWSEVIEGMGATPPRATHWGKLWRQSFSGFCLWFFIVGLTFAGPHSFYGLSTSLLENSTCGALIKNSD